MSEKRIAVVGAGAIGASTAAALIGAGHHVTLVDQWPQHVEAIRAEGLLVAMGEELQRVQPEALHLYELSAKAPVFDIVFVAVKAYDTRWSAELIAPYLAKEGYVVGLQNALCDDDIANAVGASRVVSAVIELAAEISRPGQVVRRTSPEKTWFGVGMHAPWADAASTPRVEEVRQLLACVGRVAVLPEVRAAKWTKLIVNCMMLGPLGMTGLRVGEALAIPGAHEFLMSVGSEAVAVADASGFPVQPVFGLTAQELKGSPRAVSRTLIDTLVHHIGPAVLVAPGQDYQNGRRSEVDAVNGFIARQATQLGLRAPFNEAVGEVDRRIRAGRLQPAAANLALAARLVAD